MIWITVAISIFGLMGWTAFWLQRGKGRVFSSHIDRLVDLSNQISSSVEQVSSVSHEVVSTSGEQLESLSSTVEASHEIRSMVERTTESTSLLHSQAEILRDLVGSGNRAVDQMVTTSQDIKGGIEHFQNEMQKSIEELVNALKVIQEIGNKTQVINEIVFQTKLLSFNASVEAARAGEMGKGFSVVAEEVGTLARRSGSAADEISHIVAKSVAVVDQAIQSTRTRIESLSRETAKKSEIGFTHAKSCEKIFHEMGEKVVETAQMIGHISTAAEEQAQGIGHLEQSILKFREAADRNRLVSSQSTEHARVFTQQSDGLMELAKSCASLTRRDVHARRTYQRFEWNERLEVHIAEMDDEHQRLVGKINDLIESLEKHSHESDLEGVKKAFGAMAQFAVQNFADEERYMESVGYPQLESHKKIHKKLVEQVLEFDRAISSGRFDDMKLISFLRNWLISHIMGVDMQYSKHTFSPAGARAKRSAA